MKLGAPGGVFVAGHVLPLRRKLTGSLLSSSLSSHPRRPAIDFSDGLLGWLAASADLVGDGELLSSCPRILRGDLRDDLGGDLRGEL